MMNINTTPERQIIKSTKRAPNAPQLKKVIKFITPKTPERQIINKDNNPERKCLAPTKISTK